MYLIVNVIDISLNIYSHNVILGKIYWCVTI